MARAKPNRGAYVTPKHGTGPWHDYEKTDWAVCLLSNVYSLLSRKR
jgi:hypothetical protein